MTEPHSTTEHQPSIHEVYFESLDRQAEAARLGMWVFLSSETLLFGGLFALYGGYRAAWPEAFGQGISGNDVVLGTVNTVVLITSSWLVALAVHALRVGSAYVDSDDVVARTSPILDTLALVRRD
jgi:cytochrome c oxidase subunit III